jgi:diguanylate cyclase (GGDEF)-like protein
MKTQAKHFTAQDRIPILSFLPWLILGLGLMATYGLQDVARQDARKHLQERFDFRCNEIIANIEIRLDDYGHVLRGTKALFAALQPVERNEFRDYVDTLQLAHYYPGVQGVGYAQLIAPAELAAHERQIRKEGFPGYATHPDGKRDTYTSIIYLEPFDWRNQRAFGYDMYAEPVRRAAMQRARDEDRAIASGKVTLIQETEKDVQTGFLMYLPVYRNSLPHATLGERRENLAGWVYAPFRIHDLMNGILGKDFGEIGNTLAFDIYDGDTPSAASLMYDFNAETGISPGKHDPIFRSVRHINFAGHQWTVAMRSLPYFEAGLANEKVKFIAISGIGGSLLVGFIVWLLVTGRERAFAKAREMTRELRESESRIARLNRALKLLSDCNMALVRAEDEHKLLTEVCQLIIGSGGYLLAWVGFAEQDEAKTIRSLADADHEQDYLDSMDVTWADTECGHGPTGTAIRTGVTDINQDYLSNPRMIPWRDAAIRHGYRSSIALPLAGEQGVLGALTIYAPDPNAFNPDEIKLLEELADNLAYGVVTLRARAERMQAEEKLAFMAHHDPLTQLPNRLLLRDRFDQAVADTRRKHSKVAILFLDLDNFKQVNDTLGHNHGDQLLVRVVERLRGCIRETDTISRHGGDEFTVLLTDLHDHGLIGGIAQNIIEAFAKPVEVKGNMVDVTFSIGISVFPNDGSEFDTLLMKADTAMYQIKENGRNSFRFFTQEMNSDALEQMQLQSQLRSALKNCELLLHYQPQIDIGSGDIVGFEALIRWQHPDLGMISPAKFIPLAERSGLIIPIGAWVLNEACRQAKVWLDNGHRLVMAVNLSALQFRRGNLLETVANALERSGLPSSLLELELTESIMLQDMETVMETLHELKKMGIKQSIDDFGTGYSSLSYLKRLDVDKLKIDQSFVRDMTSDSEDSAIVTAIIQLGHTLQLTVIAEGVETEAQLALLKSYGCDEAQGYLFSRPVPAEQVLDLFARSFL